jgi:hypothetical protein
MATQIQLRRDTAANWTSTNPTMAQGEAGYETDTGKLKIGDGSTAWNSLAYQAAANIVDGTIVNADVNASAAIAGTKISPDFGSQNVVTTGTATAASLNPTGSSVPTNGVYLPAANSVAISTNGTGRLFIASDGKVGLGTSSPSSLFVSDRQTLANPDAVGATTAANAAFQIAASSQTNNRLFAGINSNSNPWVQVQSTSTNATGNLAINPLGGNVGIGSNAPSQRLTIETTSSGDGIRLFNNDSTSASFSRVGFQSANTWDTSSVNAAIDAVKSGGGTATNLRFLTAGENNTGSAGLAERARIDSSGNVGIGTTAASAVLHTKTAGGEGLRIQGTATASFIRFSDAGDTSTGFIGQNTTFDIFQQRNADMRFGTNDAERARIDSSGRLLIGTSTAVNTINYASLDFTPRSQVVGAAYDEGALAVVRTQTSPFFFLCSGASGTNVSSGNGLGSLVFTGYHTSKYYTGAVISAEVDGTPGADDMPGRLVFSTTADGASSPTERMRINNVGRMFVGTTNDAPADNNVIGAVLGGTDPYTQFSRDGSTVVIVNRKTNDGDLISFKQDGTQEGTISVSGTTVSYNGAHLSRWSQLPGGAEREEILRGTVLSNIDEMCDWGEEENEQLNRMKVSDVEGDPNVSGVFQAWDDDDDTYTDDFYCAMTGDFIIRIAEGVTVQRGDLLMSAGDGTAKPQDDDIIRSKTIAKVTSTHITCTYDDGSYCVPCVLMAC